MPIAFQSQPVFFKKFICLTCSYMRLTPRHIWHFTPYVVAWQEGNWRNNGRWSAVYRRQFNKGENCLRFHQWSTLRPIKKRFCHVFYAIFQQFVCVYMCLYLRELGKKNKLERQSHQDALWSIKYKTCQQSVRLFLWHTTLLYVTLMYTTIRRLFSKFYQFLFAMKRNAQHHYHNYFSSL